MRICGGWLPGPTVAHCPLVFGRDGEALASFASYRATVVKVGMGTGTFPADMIENIRLGRMLSRLAGEEHPATIADFYRAATLGGADALGRPDLGRLAQRARADITVFDLSGFHIGRVLDPIKAITLAGTGRDSVASFIDGRDVMADFTVIGSDTTALTRSTNARIQNAQAVHAPGRPEATAILRLALPTLD